MIKKRLKSNLRLWYEILNLTDYVPLCEKIDEIIAKLNSLGVYISYLNLGGGLGVDYDNPNENPIPDFEGFFDVYLNNIKSLNIRTTMGKPVKIF